jgi:hypothetical protein
MLPAFLEFERVDFGTDGDRRDIDSARNFLVRCAKDVGNPDEKSGKLFKM